jgi:formylglycine-generating enzyme required for sulfatase activity
MKKFLISLCLGIILAPFGQSVTAAPVPYSGKVAINGANFQGDAPFTFALRDADGTIHWRNGADADSSVTLNVDRGLYVTLLGGSTMNDFPENLFLQNSPLFLVVHFFRPDTGEWLHLQPDQLITSAPHALAADVARNALTADAVKPGAITKNMLAADVLADLNATVVLPEQNATIQTGSITRSMLAPGVLSDLNATIAPGSITAGQLAPALLADLNRSVVITRSMLPESVLADLNRTLSRTDLPADVLADLNRTITRNDLPPSVLADLNRTVVISRDMLPASVLADLNRTITKNLLGSDILADLNRTITRNMLPADVLADLNKTITRNMLPADVLADLNASPIQPGSITAGKLAPEVVAVLKPVILQQPQDVSAIGGTSATFVTQATGGNLTYQWLQQGYAIAGGNGNVLTVTDLNATLHDGNYTVTVTNAFGSTESAVATLDVNGSVTQGMVGWWKFDETNGTVAADSSGNGNNGTLQGGPTWTQGKIGGALDFDGVDDWVESSYGSQFDPAADTLSISLWTKISSHTGGSVIVDQPVDLIYVRADGILQTSLGGETLQAGSINLNEWYNIVVLYDLTENNLSQRVVTITSFVNGQNVASITKSDPVGTPSNFTIGKEASTGYYLTGLLDDMRIYDRALSESEVQALYDLGLGASTTTTTTSGGATIVADSGPVTTEKMADGAVTTAKLSESILKYLRPEITTSPQAPGLVFGGQSVTLASQAEGKYLTYQWNRNGQPIAGATGATLVIPDVNGTLHDGNYTLVVSNDFGSVTSSPTGLQVDATPTNHSVASIGMQMIFCPPGTFTMGSPSSEAGRGGDETQHSVTLTNGFYLGKYEITQAQYETVMNGNSEGLNAKPSEWPNNPNRPVEKVSWDDVQIFLTRLNAAEQAAGRLPSGWSYVLPTEAEWEYACRAGTTTAYSWGDDINSSVANYNQNIGQTRDIGQYAANPWGFFDMHGNVWEWTADWYQSAYPSGTVTDPTGPASGSSRVRRGGCWNDAGAYLRSARRLNDTPGNRVGNLGFRVGFKASQ